MNFPDLTTLPDVYSLTVTGLGLAAVALTYGASRRGSPRWAITSRWARLVFVGLAVGELLRFVPALERPLWVLVGCGLLGWLLVESIWHWFAIGLISRSELPLYPVYRRNADGDEWPALRRFIEVREEIRRVPFQRVDAVKAAMIEDLALRATIYVDPAGTTRLEVFFLPLRAGGFTGVFVLSSETASGQRLVTDNFFLPYGGFYPESWSVVRRPWIRSLSNLLKLHQSRLAGMKGPLVAWDDDLVEAMNREQRQLERLNLELGFLTTPDEQEETGGRITAEGRHRLWMEIWLLHYFGVTFVR